MAAERVKPPPVLQEGPRVLLPRQGSSNQISIVLDVGRHAARDSCTGDRGAGEGDRDVVYLAARGAKFHTWFPCDYHVLALQMNSALNINGLCSDLYVFITSRHHFSLSFSLSLSLIKTVLLMEMEIWQMEMAG